MTTTALAAAGYHLVFARTASFAACLVVALVCFAGALLRPPACGSGTLLPDLGIMVSAQVAAFWWFSFATADPGPVADPVGGTLHEAAGGAIHLAMTLVTVCALRAAAHSRFGLSGVVQSGLRSLFRRLRALLSARTSTVPAVDPSRFPGARPADERCLSEVLLTGASGRRGPP
ncbi:hypothetical protein PYK79_24355 [Streptomyces sp. ID05-04B]|uniref:hypothetical protein n=1 Tax=unclassified Streptomyces TaxID=2593676 RepID=UPI000D19F1F6|nr:MULTISPECIES: hypothetical protein [unclassified Streptomyces]AVV45515.1 hypothetical protein C6376_33300 [Streptomyces sp. P3]MDX5565833.1 hypothetical protein [Streptomyces sp. ID05-04B]